VRGWPEQRHHLKHPLPESGHFVPFPLLWEPSILSGSEELMRHLALAVFVVSASVTAQVEHAPTVAQCQADQRLWLSKLEVLPPDTNLPAVPTLQQWSNEMDECKDVDPKNAWLYFNVTAESNTLQGARMIRFLKRQNLWDKFIEEDAAGKR
jgi:hypothetical protein